MTLTELKYVVAVARERHFGRAAESCFVSQPTLSVGIRKLEEDLGVSIFERGGADIKLTPIGEQVVRQAYKILDECHLLRSIAEQGKDPLKGALKVGTIHTVGPYLLPSLIPLNIQDNPDMPLILNEDYTVQILESLRSGELDCAILALPIPTTGLEILPLYREPFVAALPITHQAAKDKVLKLSKIEDDTILILGQGHCFRDQVIEFCPDQLQFKPMNRDNERILEGSSLETIRHMVAAGIGISLFPISAVYKDRSKYISYLPIHVESAESKPERTIALVWRNSFARKEAIFALADSIRKTNLLGLEFMS